MNIKRLSQHILNFFSFYVERYSPKLSHYMSHWLKLLFNFMALKPGMDELFGGKCTEASVPMAPHQPQVHCRAPPRTCIHPNFNSFRNGLVTRTHISIQTLSSGSDHGRELTSAFHLLPAALHYWWTYLSWLLEVSPSNIPAQTCYIFSFCCDSGLSSALPYFPPSIFVNATLSSHLHPYPKLPPIFFFLKE